MRSLLFLAISILIVLPALRAQEKQIKKGDEHYKIGEYAEAIPYFEEALALKDNLAAKTKLAYCYRMNNKTAAAERLYSEVVQAENARNITYFYYGETLMTNGKYDEAKQWFEKYLRTEPEDEHAKLLVRSCEEVKWIRPYFEKIQVIPFPQNSDADDNSPAFWEGGIVFSSDRNTGIRFLKEKSGWTGRDFIRLYYAAELSPGIFDKTSPFSSRLNELNKNTGNASFAYDSTAIFFTRNSHTLNKKETYNLQLFQADYEGKGRWSDVTALSFCLPESNYMHPAISPDGKELFFVSDKGGGFGGTDLYQVSRKPDGHWSKPVNLGEQINTAANEGFPFMDKEGRLYFCSKGHVGYGGFDIFFSERNADGKWASPVNLGVPINSPFDDISIHLDQKGHRGLFTSSRDGTDDDIYLFYLPDENGNLPDLLTTLPNPSPDTASIILADQQEPTPTQNLTDPKVEHAAVSEEPVSQPPVSVERTLKGAPIVKQKEPVSNQIEPIREEAIIPPQKLETEAVEMKTLEKIDTPETQKKLIKEVGNDLPVRSSLEPAGEAASTQAMSFAQISTVGKLEAGQRFVLTSVKYGIEEYAVTQNIENELNKVIDWLQMHPQLQVEIGAYTELLGNDKNNLTLSRYRAEAAMAYLIRKGIEPHRVSAQGYGEAFPLNNCKTENDCNWEEHLQNQRLELKIIDFQ